MESSGIFCCRTHAPIAKKLRIKLQAVVVLQFAHLTEIGFLKLGQNLYINKIYLTRTPEPECIVYVISINKPHLRSYIAFPGIKPGEFLNDRTFVLPETSLPIMTFKLSYLLRTVRIALYFHR